VTNEKKKQLLLQDLCARLPYGVILRDEYRKGDYELKCIDVNGFINYDLANIISHIKPYLRPMSSMTEDEEMEFEKTLQYTQYTLESYDWLNRHHFDYRGLIPIGLAIEVTEDNNPYKEK